MARVELIGPKSHFFDVVSLIHEEGKLHIEDLTKKIQAGEMPLDKMEVVAGQQAERDRMEELLIRVRGIIKALHLPGAAVDEEAREREYRQLWGFSSERLADEVAQTLNAVEGRTSELTSVRTKLEGETDLLARYEPILRKIQPLAKQLVTTGSFDSVALLFERRYKGALEQLKVELDRITHKQCDIVSTDVDEDTTAAIVVFSRTYSEPVHKFLAMENVNQIRLPSDFQNMPFDVAYDVIKQRRKELPEQLGTVRHELEQMSGDWLLRFATIRDVLTDKIDEIKTIPKFGQTSYAFVITGWIPTSELAGFSDLLSERFGQDVILNQLEISEEDFAKTPVALANAKAVAPFQSVLSAYGMPKYGTIDPTFFLFVFYPLFFGMIVGDIGYGLVMLGIVLWLRFKYHDNGNIQIATSVLGPAATMVVVFGFLYQEFFGNVFTKYLGLDQFTFHLGPVTLPFHRTNGTLIITFMIIAVAVGVLQVAFGLVLGIINGVRTKHKKHVWEKGGLLAVLVGALLLGLTFLTAVTEAIGTPFALAIQALAALVLFFGFIYAIRGGGVLGGVESILQFSNIASYIRIMAVGLAGAIFADAANGIVRTLAKNPMGIIVGVIVGILLHGLNFIIAAFSPTIHALRLNFLEFFGKFYEIGDQQYRPFHKTGGEENV